MAETMTNMKGDRDKTKEFTDKIWGEVEETSSQIMMLKGSMNSMSTTLSTISKMVEALLREGKVATENPGTQRMQIDFNVNFRFGRVRE